MLSPSCWLTTRSSTRQSASITSGSDFSSKARRRCGKRSKRQNETDRATRRRGAASAASPPGKAPSERSPRKTPGPRTLASRGNQATKLARVLKATWLARDMATIVAYPKKAGPVEASRGEK